MTREETMIAGFATHAAGAISDVKAAGIIEKIMNAVRHPFAKNTRAVSPRGISSNLSASMRGKFPKCPRCR